MELIFLGTTGSIPTTKRGLPAIALKRDREILLFDCGEGTQRQMAISHLSPVKLSSIFITHLHGDHFLGLAGLVQTLSLLDRTEPLMVYCPKGERKRLEMYLRVPHYTLTFDVLVRELGPKDEVKRKDYRILTSEVEHSVPTLAYAFVENDRPGRFYPEKAESLGVKPGPAFSRLMSGRSVKSRDRHTVTPEQVIGPSRRGRKIVYTGDTKSSENIIELAKGADVLIHDCTLADELADKAEENSHSTPQVASEVAKRAGVKQLVLIHVSPRYEDDSVLLEQAKKIFPNTIAARDLLVLEIPLQK